MPRFLDVVGITRPRGSALLPWSVHLVIGAASLLTAPVVAVAGAGGPAWVVVLLVVGGLVNAVVGLRRRPPQNAVES